MPSGTFYICVTNATVTCVLYFVADGIPFLTKCIQTVLHQHWHLSRCSDWITSWTTVESGLDILRRKYVSCQLCASATSLQKKEPLVSIHWMAGWVGHRAGLGSLKNRHLFCAHREQNHKPPVVRPAVESTVTELPRSVMGNDEKHYSDQCKTVSSKGKSLLSVK
jgi:hypothetical protein